MMFIRLTSGRLAVARGALAGGLLMLTVAAALPAEPFPFDQELMLDTAPMGRVKRVPMLAVEPNGNAKIQLWCNEVSARVELSDNAIRIEAGAVPETPPPMMIAGQCSPERMQADADTLARLTAMTAWQSKGDRLTLSGPVTMRFMTSNH